MPRSQSRVSAVIDSEASPGEARTVEPDRPFRLLVIGDFGGRASRGATASLAGRDAKLIDRDNFDEVLAEIAPEVRTGMGTLRFASLDDFHPDALLRQLPRPASASVVEPASQGASAPAARAGLLDELLGEEEDAAAEAASGGDLAAFLRSVTAGHLETRPNPEQEAAEQRRCAEDAEGLRAVLHDPAFQQVEANWRALYLLTSRLDTGGDLRLYVFDATLPELIGDLGGAMRLLHAPGRSWSLVAGAFSFGRSPVEARALRALALLVRHAGAPFLAEALPLEGEASSEWRDLRRSEEAHWAGLVLPRFLLRLPYGADTSPVESFAFEEMPQVRHEHYLWGNPAFACAYLLCESFLRDGWEMTPGTHRELRGLPAHFYLDGAEKVMKPCAEVLMTEKDAAFLMDEGVMPLATLKNQDAALLVRFQSIAEPVAALRGPWPARA